MQLTEETIASLPTPCYLLDEGKLLENAKILGDIQKRAGCKILLAQKAFSNYALYPLLAPYLAGTEASGLYEARLGREEMPGKECHVFCGAYKRADFPAVLEYADHIVFNSVSQLKALGPQARAAGKSLGLRINPECSTQTGHAIYDPCAPGSRLGATRARWDAEMTPAALALLDGLHFHTLCEQDSDALEKTLAAVEAGFGDVLPKMRWLNMGGGHHITRPGYDIPRLERCITRMQEGYGLEVYLEPGEAVALGAGYLVTEVLDVIQNGIRIAIVDASAACHMPDVLEMPYTPPLAGARPLKPGALAGEPWGYRLGGPTCLAGDVIGDYSFDGPVGPGRRLVFEDMAIYTTVKNNTFNGMPLPEILVLRRDGRVESIRKFGYDDFKNRL